VAWLEVVNRRLAPWAVGVLGIGNRPRTPWFWSLRGPAESWPSRSRGPARAGPAGSAPSWAPAGSPILDGADGGNPAKPDRFL